VAGRVGLELRNVEAIIPLKDRADLPHPRRISALRPFAFELQRREHAARGWGSAVIFSKRSARKRSRQFLPSRRRRSEDDPPAAKPATPLGSLRWTLSGSASVITTHTWLGGVRLCANCRRGGARSALTFRTTPYSLPLRCCVRVPAVSPFPRAELHDYYVLPDGETEAPSAVIVQLASSRAEKNGF
jgi:hypothetical protein